MAVAENIQPIRPEIDELDELRMLGAQMALGLQAFGLSGDADSPNPERDNAVKAIFEGYYAAQPSSQLNILEIIKGATQAVSDVKASDEYLNDRKERYRQEREEAKVSKEERGKGVRSLIGKVASFSPANSIESFVYNREGR